jgi:hypothetical protein
MFLNEKLKEIVGEPVADAPLKKADPFSLDSLIAWLEKQPGDDKYCFFSYGQCLFALYTVASGGALPADSDNDYVIGTSSFSIWSANWPEWASDVAANGPFTFGAALSRARALRDAP